MREGPNRNKYHARRLQYAGHSFDSQAEARRYEQLRLLEAGQAISNLVVHPRYLLIPAFVDRTGKRHVARWYTPDFAYVEDGVEVVEDVKGGRATMTDASSLRMALFQYQNPSVELRIVKA